MEATKTDLRLLLECLKYQMKWPGSQKQALLTIISICKQNDQYVEFLREIGGISFIYNLSKSSTFSQVKETALFTLASLAELHESCKQALCREEMFRDFVQHLEQEMPLTEKRVAVYMLSVLVANNRCGQTLAKTSRCIEALLRLFRQSFPVPGESYEQLQLWTTVSSALCGSVNNPQNEENQNVCMSVFPEIKPWLQEVALPRAELAQPLCSFIGMTVANNPCAQEYFVSVGGLDSLSDTLTRVLSQSTHSASVCKMATIITKTLSACISNNELLGSSLSKLRVIPGLLRLLSSPNLDPQDQLAVVLTTGHLTDACVEQQSQLLSAGGLPIIITLLTETSDEELKKAAIFVLHTCNRITESLGPGMSTIDPNECDREGQWRSAGQILQRIQLLEKKIGKKLWERDPESQPHSMKRSDSHVECDDELWEGSVMRKVKGNHRVYGEFRAIPAGTPITSEILQDQDSLQPDSSEEGLSPVQVNLFKGPNWEKSKKRKHKQKRENERSDNQETRREGVNKRELKRNVKSERVVKRLKMMNLESDDDGYELLQNCSTPTEGNRDTQGPDIFRHPDPVKRNQREPSLSDDNMSLCTELLDKEINKYLKPPSASKSNTLRCAGYRLTPLRRPHETYSPDMKQWTDHRHLKKSSEDARSKNSSGRHRKRQNWSDKELCYLTKGVKRFGHSWNTILWKYPFHPGRTNVDLAKKFYHMQKAKAQGVDLSVAKAL